MNPKPTNYTWNAKDYAANSQNQQKWAKELIPKLKLHNNEALLDIGCGDGKITAELARYIPNGKAVGVDSSAQMINLAQTTFPQTENPNLSFNMMDARSLTFQEEFDVAFSNAALHWIQDQKAVLAGVKKSLKNGGRLLFQMAGKGNAKAVLEIFEGLMALTQWRQYFHSFSFPYAFLGTQEYLELLQWAELQPLRVEMFPRDLTFPSAEGMAAGWVRTTWLPFTERVPAELRQSFIEEIVNRYIEKYGVDAEGRIHLDMVRLEVEAKKLR